jgi:DNA-binding MarR family transcriptional regulator/ribosomal protein S18 acetylase RimI-like enzyme
MGSPKTDLISELGPLALGSRLKRLSDRMMREVTEIYRQSGLDFEPKWFPLYYLLVREEAKSITEIAERLQMTHPGVIQIAREMEKAGWVVSERSGDDARRRLLRLTPEALAALPRLEQLWLGVRATNLQILQEVAPGFLGTLDQLDQIFVGHAYQTRFRLAQAAAQPGAVGLATTSPEASPEKEPKARAQEPIQFVNCQITDLPTIFGLYDQAIAYQKTVFHKQWLGFDQAMIEAEVRENRQWKGLVGGEVACIFAVSFSDAQFWGELDREPAIYLHRIVTNPAFRGGGYVRHIVDWAKPYARQLGKAYVRLDTWGDNQKLIDYYVAHGFAYLKTITLGQLVGLPKHYQGTLALLQLPVG